MHRGRLRLGSGLPDGELPYTGNQLWPGGVGMGRGKRFLTVDNG